MSLGRWWMVLTACFFCGMLGLVAVLSAPQMDQPESSHVAKGAALAGLFGNKSFGGGFKLVDQTGNELDSSRIGGDGRLIYFGFTYCPDVCPTSLGKISTAVDLLEKQGYQVQPVFITIDPERDTPEVLDKYLDHFHPRFIGLTGSDEELADVLARYRIFSRKKPGTTQGEYMFDHTSFIFFCGPDERVVGVFETGMPPERIAAAVSANLQ